MKELSVGEQRYKAVMAVLSGGRTVTEVARDGDVSRQTLHAGLARYEQEGMEGMGDRSHRPAHCPHQMPALIEVRVLEMRRQKPFWGPRRLALELARKGVTPTPSASAIYRCLLRAGVIQPVPRRWRREDWKRWERGAAMELWQLDVVGGFHLADGTTAKACEGFSLALRKYGVPDQVLTDNGKVFTGRFAQPPVEVLFDRICRENGIEHLLTQPRSPTTTGKIERFHKTLRLELDTRQVFKDITTAQEAMDEWVEHYNAERPHRSLDDVTPASRFKAGTTQVREPERNGDYWVSRKVTSNGIVCVGYQKVNVGQRNAGSACDILVRDGGAAVLGGQPAGQDGGASNERSDSQEECRGAGPAALVLQRSVKDQPNQLRQASTDAAHRLQFSCRSSAEVSHWAFGWCVSLSRMREM
jgi:transposase InsO family protein